MKTVKGTKFFVSRQKYFGEPEEDGTIVEIAEGGQDYANADMLVPKWKHLGEGKEFYDPCEAVNAAIAICEEWKRTNPHAKVAMGATGGFSMPFSHESYDTLQERAEKLRETLPRCDGCGGLIQDETYTHESAQHDETFCSESCAEKDYESHQNADEDEEDE